MASELDDINQTTVYIPYEESDAPALPISTSPGRDLPDGPLLRFDAYKNAWKKCLDRIQDTVRALHAPTALQVVEDIHTVYKDAQILPGLPYHELPVMSLTGANAALLTDITARLSSSDPEDPAAYTCHITHLRPTDCTSIMTGMKALIGGFIDGTNDGVKRKATASLANYDINLLEAWYVARADRHEGVDTRLVVFLHDFEQFDRLIVQDMLYICSLHVTSLPLVFVFLLSSPPVPSYIHTTYPRSTLALLRVSAFSVPRGKELLEEVMLKTFFDPAFEPSIVLGPAALDFLEDFYTRHDSSIDALITILHLIHLKFFDEPLTVLVHDSHLGTPTLSNASNKLSLSTSRPFLDALFARLHAPPAEPEPEKISRWRNQDVPALLAAVDGAREAFAKEAAKVRMGVALLLRVQRSVVCKEERGILDVARAAVRGRLGREARGIITAVKELPVEKVSTLLQDLAAFFEDLHKDEYEEPLRKFTRLMTRKPDGETLGAALARYFLDSVVDLGDSTIVLSDVWYTGSTPFPSELINPSVRASVVSGLLYPHAYADQGVGDGDDKALWELPDTSILIARYLDSGRMVNVHDWYESFVSVLQEQRRQLGDGDGDEEWDLEVQARFIRALHELDYLGFIRHTGRKAGHVMKTVFDLPD